MSITFAGVPPSTWEQNGQRYDCVYSPDDGGYYLERHSDSATSQVFHAACQAWESLTENKVEWDA